MAYNPFANLFGSNYGSNNIDPFRSNGGASGSWGNGQVLGASTTANLGVPYGPNLPEGPSPAKNPNTPGQPKDTYTPSNPTPTPTPVPTPAPTPQPQQTIDISELYAPALAAADQAEQNVRTGATEDIDALDKRISQAEKNYMTQQDQLLADTAGEEDAFNKTLRSALSEAMKSYNALQQQGRSRFGAYSSAGQAIGELARQEFFKQQGNVQSKGVEGAADFAKERGRIKSFIGQKIDDLKLYKEEAMTEIQKNLRDQLAQISARRGDIEANKTQDKMNLLADARNQIKAIQDADRNWRMQIAAEAINREAQISGRSFSPQEIKAYIDEFAFGIPTSVAPQTTSTAGQIRYNPNATSDEDYLKSLAAGRIPVA